MKNVYKILAAFLLLGSYAKSQVTVTGGSTATYSTVNTAFAAINAGTHFGAITIDITASTTESTTPTPLNASGQGGANYTSIVLRPTVTATISGAMVTGRGVLELDGSDNVTIDGDISGGPVTRELTIVNNAANTVASTAVIRLIGRTTLGLGATNNTIKNCVIIGNTEGNDGISGSTVTSSHGIYAGNNAVALLVGSTTGADYDNNTIENNDIRKAYFAIYVGSATANTSGNLNIKNNIIGSNTVGETITAGGINLSGVVSATLSQNEVFNLTPNTSISPYGIQIAGAGSASVTISRNNVHGIKSLSISGWGAYGISISGGTDHLMVNNIVYDIMTVNYLSTSTLNAIGLRLASGTGHKIYYNSVNLYGAINLSTGTSTSVASAALFVTSAACTGLDIKNNIFCNIQTSTVTTQKFMAVWFPSTYDFANAVLNNNSYNVTNDGDHFVGKVGTTNGLNEASTLGAWQALSQVNNPTNDLNSIPASNMAAPFTSNTNLTIPPNTVYGAESGAVLIPSLGTNIDYNAAVRPLAGVNANLNPDMGAYEFDGIAGIPIDAGLQSLISPATTGCYTSAENVVVSIKNYGTSAISNIPVTVIVSGAVNQTYTATYIPIITAGATANFTVGVLNMLTSGTYSFNGSTSLAGDGNAINDALTTTIRTVIAPSTLPQFVNFTGFTGSNLPTFFPLWTEATGTAVPTGTTSTWTSQTNLNTTGNVNARVLLQTNTNDEWIVGPKFTATANSQVTFDAALTGNTTAPFTPDAMGSDDKVRVMVSTDCGASFTPVFTISATNSLTTSFTNFSVPLGAYAGQNIIVAFLAQDGPVDDIESYYFQLDNINLYNTSATDAGVSAFVAPGIGCYTSSEPLVVQVNNFGTAPISNFPVSVWVSGAIVQTLTATYTGTLAVAASANFTVGSVNMTTAGQYNFKGFTSLVGDLNAFNDTALIVRNVTATSTLPQFVDFTGFTGANLPTPFPLWTEATGTAVPTGTTSSWTTQANLNSVGNTNARVLLSTNTNDEWIVGPKFTATANSQVSFDASLTNNTTAPFTPDAMGSDDMVRVMV
ncbi:MAG: choice-of-anchor J domain-containing protein, partial [Bacteroidota bacterium]|nr:choice-of-anchor J domain-containing protein [Bacteroidota bacterium]